jgi:hypothetical protein
MRKSKAVRVVGFVGALGASAALVGFAATGTGAYFTDSKPGSINASTGSVKLIVSPSDGKLNFTNLLPGEYQDQNIDYTAAGTGSEDIWMVLPSDGSAEALVGQKDDGSGGGLGRYGHFAVTAPDGSFTSYNLANRPPSDPNGPVCGVDGNGHGGSNQVAADKKDYSLPYCAPANAILLQSGLTYGQGGRATVTFGFTPLLTGPQSGPLSQVAAYKIVATQHGIRPENSTNPAN